MKKSSCWRLGVVWLAGVATLYASEGPTVAGEEVSAPATVTATAASAAPHVDNSAGVVPEGETWPADVHTRLADFAGRTGVFVLVRYHAASPTAEEDARPGLYMRGLATKLDLVRAGVLAVYFADEREWRVWIGDELTARFAGRAGAVEELTKSGAIHDVKEAMLAEAQAEAEKAPPAERLRVHTTALLDRLLPRITAREAGRRGPAGARR